METTINETKNANKVQSRTMPNRLSNVFEDIDNEELLHRSDEQINKNLDEDSESNKLIQNKKEYEINAPLIDDEDGNDANKPKSNIKSSNMSSSRSNQNIQVYNSNNSITNGNRVKFSSDYSIPKSISDLKQSRPLLEKSENSQDEDQPGKGRFVVSHVKDPKNILDKPNDDNKYFIDEKGSILRRSESTQSNRKIRKETSELSETDSKAIQFRYNKDAKSLEVSINIGNSGGSKENGCFSQLKCAAFYQALFAETLGTYLIVLYVCSFGLPIADPNDPPAGINGCLGSGLVVASLVWCLGHIGGANFNPAVSIALLITGQSNLIRVIFYIACQLLGSVLASLTLLELVPDHVIRPNAKLVSPVELVTNSSILRSRRDLISPLNSTVQPSVAQEPKSDVATPMNLVNIGVTLLSDQITPLQGYFVEVIITFILVFSIFACIDKRRNDLTGSFPLTIGFAVTVGALFGGNFTGGSMNPARSFGPAFVMQNWSNHWIYWAGPISGAVIAGILYNLLVVKKKYLIKK